MMKQKLDVVTTFSGVGMQERGILNSGLFDMNLLATSDVDKNAILSYAAIHCGLTNDLVNTYDNYPLMETMVKELYDKRIGYDFIKDKQYNWEKLAKRKDGFDLKKYWLAMHLANNLGDISKAERLPKCDLLTFSFPCQSISIAGKQEGIVAKETRSGLVYEIVRLIEVANEHNELPKYLLLENVSALVSKKFINDFNNLNQFFDEIGYNVYWQVMNAKNTGIPQNRPRVFAIYIRKDIDNKEFIFPKPFDNGLRMKDFLDINIDDKYYLSDKISERFKITDETFKKDIEKRNFSNYCLRKITPKECFALMGMSKDDCQNCYDIGASDTILYKQAGNGIVTNCINLIMQHLYKDQYDKEYICIDEKILEFQNQSNISFEKNTNKILNIGTVCEKSLIGGRVVFEDGVSQTITAGCHGYSMGYILANKNTNKIFKEDIPQKVKVRKYKVDINVLQNLLRENKTKLKLSNKDIANALNKPLTLVEHWFRKDNCFSIPDTDVWFDLKKLLEIDADDFDESIMTFEYRDGVYEKSDRCYYDFGISPTLTCDGNINLICRKKEG